MKGKSSMQEAVKIAAFALCYEQYRGLENDELQVYWNTSRPISPSRDMTVHAKTGRVTRDKMAALLVDMILNNFTFIGAKRAQEPMVHYSPIDWIVYDELYAERCEYIVTRVEFGFKIMLSARYNGDGRLNDELKEKPLSRPHDESLPQTFRIGLTKQCAIDCWAYGVGTLMEDGWPLCFSYYEDTLPNHGVSLFRLI